MVEQSPANDALASAEEEEAVKELRTRLEPEISALAANGRDFPHTTGDLFLLRVLRGMGANLDKAVEWYRNFLELRKQHDLDAIHESCEAAKLPWKASAMPHSQEVLKCWNAYFDEADLVTPRGDLLWYDAFGDTKPTEVVAIKDKFVEFQRTALERRMSTLDRLSHEQGRVVKIVKIIDCAGVGFWLLNKELEKIQRGLVRPLTVGTSIEVLQKLFLINMPWWSHKVWATFERTLPARIVSKTRLLGNDFLQNQEFMATVGAPLAAQIPVMRRVGEDGDDGSALEGSNVEVLAGRALERAVQVTEKQRISWEFQLGAPKDSRGVVGGLLDRAVGEATDVNFSVSLWPEPKPDATEEETFAGVETFVPPQKVGASDGLVEGSAEATCTGTAVLRWSNQHSWVRAKVLSSFKVTV